MALFGNDFEDPRTQGLLGLAMGLLEAGGPQERPTSFGQALARGGAAGMGAYGQAKKAKAEEEERQMMKVLRDSQVQQLLAKAKRDQELAARGVNVDQPAVLQIADALSSADPAKAALIREALRAPTMVAGTPMREGAGGMQPIIPVDVVGDIKRRLAQQQAFGAGIGKAETEFTSGADEAGRPAFIRNIDQLRALGLGGGRMQSQNPEPDIRGNFTGDLSETLSTISRIVDPQAKREALQAFEQQYGSRGQGSSLRPLDAAKPALAQEQERRVLEERRVAKLKESMPKAKASIGALNRSADQMVSEIDKLLSSPGINLITGYVSNIPTKYVKGSPGYDAAVRVQYLLDKVVVEAMKDLKSLSQTGSTGFGQMSEREGARLENYVAPIREGTSTEMLKEALGALREWAIAQKYQARTLFEDEYGAGLREQSAPDAKGGGSSIEALRKKYGM